MSVEYAKLFLGLLLVGGGIAVGVIQKKDSGLSEAMSAAAESMNEKTYNTGDYYADMRNEQSDNLDKYKAKIGQSKGDVRITDVVHFSKDQVMFEENGQATKCSFEGYYYKTTRHCKLPCGVEGDQLTFEYCGRSNWDSPR